MNTEHRSSTQESKENVRQVRVAVCIGTEEGPGRARLAGFSRYAIEQGWRLLLVRSNVSAARRQLVDMAVTGAVVYDQPATMLGMFRQLGIPVVEASARHPRLSDAAVFADDEKIAESAAAHLRNSGYEHLACARSSQAHQAMLRVRHFEKVIARDGGLALVFPGDALTTPFREWARWLRLLPKPCGIFASDDRVGEHIVSSCKILGIPVPEVVGVLGVGNDELICDLTHPQLSSIMIPAVAIGRRAAEMLDCLMEGRGVGAQVAVAPMEVLARGSTDKLETADPIVTKTLRFIRSEGTRPIGTPEIAASVGVQRRTLERRVRQATGGSVHDQLVAFRLREAKRLLRVSELPLNEIAIQCGYLAPSAFIRMFRKSEGMPPAAYRALYRNGEGQ